MRLAIVLVIALGAVGCDADPRDPGTMVIGGPADAAIDPDAECGPPECRPASCGAICCSRLPDMRGLDACGDRDYYGACGATPTTCVRYWRGVDPDWYWDCLGVCSF